MFDVDLDPPLTHLDPAIEYTLTEDTLIGQKSLAVTVKQEELAAVASETISLTFRILKADDASPILQESIQITYVNCFIHLAMPDLTSGIFEPVFLTLRLIHTKSLHSSLQVSQVAQSTSQSAEVFSCQPRRAQPSGVWKVNLMARILI